MEELSRNETQNSFGFDIGNGSFNGMIGVLQRNEADIAIQVGKWVRHIAFIDKG